MQVCACPAHMNTDLVPLPQVKLVARLLLPILQQSLPWKDFSAPCDMSSS